MSEPLRIQDQYNFELTKRLAEGGMGSVYEAIQIGAEGFRKRMAIKMIHEDISRDAEFVEMFIGEAKLVANLVHQNIVQIYQLGRYGNRFYIAMEYISGVNLHELQVRHKDRGSEIPPDLTAFIISRVCRALEYAHRKRDDDGTLLGVVHRDVSPRNIMMNFEGVVKLADFGIAKATDFMMDREGDILLGKTAYMSPEQASFLPTDARSDLFSLGICAYETLTGDVLFEQAETLVMLEKVMQEPIPPLSQVRPDCPPELSRIIERSLERDLNKRYPNAREMGDDLEHFLYDKGFGPTNQTLEKHLLEIFPDLQPFWHTQPES